MPKDFSESLNDMDLSFVYGMEWLKRNGNSTELNQALLKQNPMLPYSIIMSDKGIGQLNASQVDFIPHFRFRSLERGFRYIYE